MIPPRDEQHSAAQRARVGHVHSSRESFSPGTGRRLRLLVGGVLTVLALGFAAVHTKRSISEHHLADEAALQVASRSAVEVVTAKATPAQQPLVMPGEVNAWFESTIYARVNGYVGGWTADIGDHVQRGQVLATIETPELDADLAAAKAKLRASEAEVKVREAHAEFAKTTYVRWRDSPKGVVSEQEQFDKKAQFESAQAELQAAQAQVNVDQAQVDRLNSFEQFKNVTAPYAGVITERHVDIGNLVSAGSSTQTTPLYRMSQADTVRVMVNVPQSAATDLMKVGTEAQVTNGDMVGRQFKGAITRTSQSIDPHARTFKAEIDLPNADMALLPGLYVQVAFQLSNNGTVQVPASAMVFRTQGPQVAVVGTDNKVGFVRVSIARDNGNFVELSSGVKPGDRLIVNVSNQVMDGDVVQVANVDGTAQGQVQ